MKVQAQAPQFYPYALSGCIRDAPQGEVANSLDRDPSCYAQDGKKDE